MSRRGLPLLLLFLLTSLCAYSAEEQDRLIRNTEARTAEDQRKGFHLPDGFSIQLFADEIQLGGKPINMAFDARGRLWVSSTREYPYAVPKARWSDPQGTRAKDSRDTIRILEDTDGDGRADKVTIFADELNIPTGVLPYKNGCIAWSIPNIWFLDDTDGDGTCDTRRILFGPLGYERDTHGMISSLRLGLDGWVYATHGFSNTSHFEARPENKKTADRADDSDKGKATATDQNPSAISAPSAVKKPGLTLDITSGSVFRFKPDGSRVELWTSGQVNPFGLCWDSWGNLYSADCHSNPITQLIRGATYPQFGKTTDPLGFGPVMCTHAHGSTGLCGIVYLDGDVWGPEWNDHMFVGNCVTSRVNHDHITFTGSTPKANEAPDFLTSDDPWFRPVDLQLGPDSALYVADFYNRVIGHYEVPLDHPGRDKDRGRIWRVVKEGFTGKLTECDLSKRDAQTLLHTLGSPNITLRYLATTHVAADTSTAGIDRIESALHKSYKAENSYACQHLMWSAVQIRDSLSVGPEWARSSKSLRTLTLFAPMHVPFIEAATCRVFTHLGESGAHHRNPLVFEPMPEDRADPYPEPNSNGDPRVSRAMAIQTRVQLAERFSFSSAEAWHAFMRLFRIMESAHPDDLALKHEISVNLRQLLNNAEYIALGPSDLRGLDSQRRLAELVASVETEAAAEWLLAYVKRVKPDPAFMLRCFANMARNLRSIRDEEIVSLARQHFAETLDTQLDLLAAIREGRSLSLQSRDVPQASATSAPPSDSTSESRATDPLATWSAELTDRLLAALQSDPPDTWHPVTPPTVASPNPWHPKVRKCADGKERNFFDSHVAPGSEKLTGTLRSAAFPLPTKLNFWIAGHRGFPTAPPTELTYVRLVDADTHEELARAYPPRNDLAQEINWAFDQPRKETQAPRQTFFELTDTDSATAYAWLAAGGFDPAVVTIPTDPLRRDKRIRHLAELCTPRSADDLKDAGSPGAFVADLRHKSSFTPDTRFALARFLASTSPDPSAALLVPLSRDEELASTAFTLLQPPVSVSDSLVQAFRILPFRSQAKLATALAGSVKSANRLLAIAPPAVLAEPLVSSTLNALDDGKVSQRLKSLTASLPPQNESLQKLITQRLKSFNPANADTARGELVFTAVCSICHRIGVRGNLVGPQLDGIGARGIERLLEDILDPNRLVDPAFRLHMVKRKDGSLFAGLLRREEGEKVIFADAMAQETAIAKTDISADDQSPFSLMPPGLGEALTEQQLHDLLAYLLARK